MSRSWWPSHCLVRSQEVVPSAETGRCFMPAQGLWGAPGGAAHQGALECPLWGTQGLLTKGPWGAPGGVLRGCWPRVPGVPLVGHSEGADTTQQGVSPGGGPQGDHASSRQALALARGTVRLLPSPLQLWSWLTPGQTAIWQKN